MKRLVLCFDGTWNTLNPKELTNVVKIANTVSLRGPDGTDQVCYYNSGVGSGGPIDRFVGGVFGAGLKSNVKRALAFLALNYQGEDEIYLFGFSRGAYTARAVAGVLGVAGIPLEIGKAEIHWDFYRRIAKLQSDNRGRNHESRRYKSNLAQINDLTEKLKAYTNYSPDEVNITCVGVFDTVGSYGVPAGFGLSGLANLFTYWTRAFHSRQIGKKVGLGLHAVAIDEMRRPFYPTFWMRTAEEQLPPAQKVEQMWFPGTHSNVGGGWPDNGLSDTALAWMISRVTAQTGLAFDDSELLRTVWPCSAATLYRTSWGGPFARVRSILPKPANTLITRAARFALAPFRRQRIIHTRVNEGVHWSVRERAQWPQALVDGKVRVYKPKNLRVLPDEVSDVTDLEAMLLRRDRPDWSKNCPLRQKGKDCVCEARARIAEAANLPAAAE